LIIFCFCATNSRFSPNPRRWKSFADRNGCNCISLCRYPLSEKVIIEQENDRKIVHLIKYFRWLFLVHISKNNDRLDRPNIYHISSSFDQEITIFDQFTSRYEIFQDAITDFLSLYWIMLSFQWSRESFIVSLPCERCYFITELFAIPVSKVIYNSWNTRKWKLFHLSSIAMANSGQGSNSSDCINIERRSWPFPKRMLRIW
jgi:hypothetical protein